jgi:hypothetical protein
MLITGLAVCIGAEALSASRLAILFRAIDQVDIVDIAQQRQLLANAVRQYEYARYISVSGLVMIFTAFLFLLFSILRGALFIPSSETRPWGLPKIVSFVCVLVTACGVGVMVQATILMTDGFLYFFGGRWEGSLRPALGRSFDVMHTSHRWAMIGFLSMLIMYLVVLALFLKTQARRHTDAGCTTSGTS